MGQRDVGPKIVDEIKPKGFTDAELQDIERQLDAMKLKLSDPAAGAHPVMLTVLGKPRKVWAIRWDTNARESKRVYFYFDERLGRLELREAQQHGETLWMKKVRKPNELRRARQSAENFIKTQGLRVVEQRKIEATHYDYRGFTLWPSYGEKGYYVEITDQEGLSEEIPVTSFPTRAEALLAAKKVVDEKFSWPKPEAEANHIDVQRLQAKLERADLACPHDKQIVESLKKLLAGNPVTIRNRDSVLRQAQELEHRLCSSQESVVDDEGVNPTVTSADYNKVDVIMEYARRGDSLSKFSAEDLQATFNMLLDSEGDPKIDNMLEQIKVELSNRVSNVDEAMKSLVLDEIHHVKESHVRK